MRQPILLIGSYVLYLSWGVWFAGVLLASTAMNFLLGEWLRRRPTRLALTIGILLNLALLGSFKYLPEVAVNLPLPSLQRFAHLALPLGISFWTFQAMSYLFDLYRGEELDPSFFEFALYMAFFPVAISGPICRMPDMLPQFRSEKVTSWNEIGARVCSNRDRCFDDAAGRGCWGREFSPVMESTVGSITPPAGAAPTYGVWHSDTGYSFSSTLPGTRTLPSALRKALGFTLPENFARPFQSTTPSIFWTRWHMSLSFWIRDYVFLPLAMVRREMWWRNLALVLSMVLFGLWHKASVLFLLWGCYHGVLLVLHRQFQQLRGSWAGILQPCCGRRSRGLPRLA